MGLSLSVNTPASPPIACLFVLFLVELSDFSVDQGRFFFERMGGVCVKSQPENNRGGGDDDSSGDERGQPAKSKANKRVKVLLLGNGYRVL